MYDDEWKDLHHRHKKVGTFQVKRLYKDRIKIKNEKFDHL